MKEDFLKAVQKFLNSMFLYSDLLKFTDQQKDFLLRKDVLNKMDDNEYNAAWDTLLDIENMFSFAKNRNVVIGTKTSVSGIFNQNLKWRQSVKK